jgi:hypothetical protein
MNNQAREPRRVRPLLLVLLWAWAICVFLVLDLFLNVEEFDGIRPRSNLYRGMRFAAHRMVGEPYREDDEFAARDRVQMARRSGGFEFPDPDLDLRARVLALDFQRMPDLLVALRQLERNPDFALMSALAGDLAGLETTDEYLTAYTWAAVATLSRWSYESHRGDVPLEGFAESDAGRLLCAVLGATTRLLEADTPAKPRRASPQPGEQQEAPNRWQTAQHVLQAIDRAVPGYAAVRPLGAQLQRLGRRVDVALSAPRWGGDARRNPDAWKLASVVGTPHTAALGVEFVMEQPPGPLPVRESRELVPALAAAAVAVERRGTDAQKQQLRQLVRSQVEREMRGPQHRQEWIHVSSAAAYAACGGREFERPPRPSGR